MPYCENCGNEISSDAKFCPNCGKEVAHHVEEPINVGVFKFECVWREKPNLTLAK